MNDTPPDTPPAGDKPTKSSVVLLLAVVLGAIAVSQTFLRREPDEAEAKRPPEAGEATVLLIIDTDDAPPREVAVGWVEGLTVFAALELALADAPQGVEKTGEGESVFVDSVAGIPNEGPGGRYWQYYVNGERGEVSAGVRTLAEGDRVLWKFAPAD